MIGGVSFIQFFVPVVQTVVLCADASKVPRLLEGVQHISELLVDECQKFSGMRVFYVRASVSTVVDGWRSK